VVALSFFAHELGVLLLPAFCLALLWQVRGGGQPRLWRLATVLLPIVVGLAIWAVLALTLRADTAAGALGEVDTFTTLRRGDLTGLQFYLGQLVPTAGSWLLLVATLAGLALGRARQRQRLGLVLAAAIPLLLASSFALPLRPRYGLALLPLFYLLSAVGLVTLGGWLYQRRPSGATVLAATSLGVLIVAAQIDFDAVRWNDRRESRTHAFWIADLYALGYRPGDLVMTDASTIVHRHLGRTDYWLRSTNYDRYVTLSRGRRYDIHTGALLIRTVEEYERRVEEPNRGRTIWVIASNTSYSWATVLDPRLQVYFGRQAAARANSRDGTSIYKLEPQRGRSGRVASNPEAQSV
jgi:hypothetical protein